MIVNYDFTTIVPGQFSSQYNANSVVSYYCRSFGRLANAMVLRPVKM